MATKRKPNPILLKIVAEAKRIQKAHPNMKWTNAIKDAAKHIKSGAKTVVKKKKSVSGIRSEAKDLAKRAAKKAASSVKKAAKKSVKSGLLKLAHSKYLSGIGSTAQLTSLLNSLHKSEGAIINHTVAYKNAKKNKHPESIKMHLDCIKKYKKMIPIIKKQIALEKKKLG
jgi:hypothetical protein